MRIAVIGSGIAGLSAAYLLSKHGHEVSVFERAGRLGMDSHGVDVDVGAAVDTSADPAMRSAKGPNVLRIDMPLRVFQESYYPHLTHLYGEVGVRYRPEDYAASFTSLKGAYHFGYRNLIIGTFSLPYVRRFKPLDPAFWRILRDCLRFFVLKWYSRAKIQEHTFIEFLTDQRFSTEFIKHMIIPTMAVLCTCSYEAIEQYPAHIVIDYLSQRSMRGVRRLVSGAQDVVARLSAHCREVKLGTSIDRICLCGPSVTVHESSGASSSFDQVVLAVQANHALGMLERGPCAACAKGAKPSSRLSELVGALRCFRYEKIEVALHSDPALMPIDRAAWSPVNLVQNEKASESMASIWMNAVHSRLGATRGAKDVFQTVNPLVPPRPELTYAHSTFERPVVTHKSLAAIRTLHDLQGKDRLWIVGSYAAVGVPLLETGVTSAVAVCRALGASCSWDQAETLQTASSAPSHRSLALQPPRGLRPLFMLVALLAVALSMAAGVFARSAEPL